VQAANEAPSRLQVKELFASVEVKLKFALVLFVSAFGFAVIVVSGAVVSTEEYTIFSRSALEKKLVQLLVQTSATMTSPVAAVPLTYCESVPGAIKFVSVISVVPTFR
jgi:hypothetical protein